MIGIRIDARLVARLAIAGLFTLTVACGSTLREVESPAAHGATPSPAPTAGAPSGSPAPGTVRLTDDAVGVSFDIRRGWSVEKYSRLGRSIHSFDPASTATAYMPPPGEVTVRVEVMRDLGITDLEAFADRHVWIATCPPCRRIVERGHARVGGEEALFFSVWQSEPQPRQELEPSLYWLVRSPFLAGRVLVIKATPAASPRRPDVERVVATVQFYPPAPPDLTPTRTRQEVIGSIRSIDGWTITRIEAKLVLYPEWERAAVSATPPGGPGFAASAHADPDLLIWVVAFTGSGFTPMKGGPPGPLGAPAVTPRPWGWALRVLPAREPYDWGGPFIGGPGDAWPAYFDALADRAR